jgi:hypothetical protein
MRGDDMELTDLTKEQRDKLNTQIMPLLESEDGIQEAVYIILKEYPKLVYITREKLLDYVRSCNEELRNELSEKQEELKNIQANYELKKQIISENFNLTLDEVEEINERFKFKHWAAFPIIFKMIVLCWKLKRIFKRGTKS